MYIVCLLTLLRQIKALLSIHHSKILFIYFFTLIVSGSGWYWFLRVVITRYLKRKRRILHQMKNYIFEHEWVYLFFFYIKHGIGITCIIVYYLSIIAIKYRSIFFHLGSANFFCPFSCRISGWLKIEFPGSGWVQPDPITLPAYTIVYNPLNPCIVRKRGSHEVQSLPFQIKTIS